jgi:hypothetical protein
MCGIGDSNECRWDRRGRFDAAVAPLTCRWRAVPAAREATLCSRARALPPPPPSWVVTRVPLHTTLRACPSLFKCGLVGVWAGERKGECAPVAARAPPSCAFRDPEPAGAASFAGVVRGSRHLSWPSPLTDRCTHPPTKRGGGRSVQASKRCGCGRGLCRGRAHTRRRPAGPRAASEATRRARAPAGASKLREKSKSKRACTSANQCGKDQRTWIPTREGSFRSQVLRHIR